jgi:hypothetical protein
MLIGVSALAIVAADIVAAMGRRPGGGALSRFIVGAIARATSGPRDGGSAALLLAIPVAWLVGAAGGVRLIASAWAAAGWPDDATARTFAIGLLGTMALCSAVFLRRVLAARARSKALVHLVDGLAKTPEEAAAYLSREDSPYTRAAVETLLAATAKDHARDPVLHLAGGGERFTAVVERLRDAYALLNRGGGRRDLRPLHAAISACLRSAESLARTRAEHRLVYHHSRGSKS